MFIKKTSKNVKGVTYVNHLLVESISTPKGPRHETICSLGSLAPAPREQWLALAHKIQQALSGQEDLFPDPVVTGIVRKVRAKESSSPPAALVEKQEAPSAIPAPEPASNTAGAQSDLVSIHTDQVQMGQMREAGPVHVGHQLWRQLDLDAILATAQLDPRTRLLTEIMTLNRLIAPASEHAMPDWARRSAVEDILQTDLADLNDTALYRNLDRLHPQRQNIERQLAQRERTLFNLDESLLLYDLTSTYFEGQCPLNPQAKLGYSRDHRPDCKQVVVGLVIDRDGFPKAHEVFDGNRTDSTTVKDMLDVLETRVGRNRGATVVVDRGMAYKHNIESIRGRGYHYIVACQQKERDRHLDDFKDSGEWKEVVREPSPRNPGQKKTRVQIQRREVGDELHVLCVSEGREAKDRAIREKQDKRYIEALQSLQSRIAKRNLKKTEKIHEAIGRLRERYPRVARYYDVQYDADTATLSWPQWTEKKEKDQELDGAYLLKSDRRDLSDEEIWRTYILLTRVENAFRNIKSPLAERPIFHHLQNRVQTHIFLCVLAYHLLVAIEKHFLDRGIHTSWATVREQLSTHQVGTVYLPADNGDVLTIRQASMPEDLHRAIYDVLQIPAKVMEPVRIWHTRSHEK